MENPYEELIEYADTHTEAETKQWVMDNLKRFPEDAQEEIVFAFFQDGLDESFDADEKLANLEEEGVDAMHELDKTEKTLHDLDEVESLREELGQ